MLAEVVAVLVCGVWWWWCVVVVVECGGGGGGDVCVGGGGVSFVVQYARIGCGIADRT